MNNVSIHGSSFSVGNFASRLQSGELKEKTEEEKTPLWLKDDETTENTMHFLIPLKYYYWFIVLLYLFHEQC